MSIGVTLNLILDKLKLILKRIFGRTQEFEEKFEQLSEKEEYIEQLKQCDLKYHPEFVDVKLALECKEYLAKVFPYGIRETVQNLSNQELLELFKNIEKDAEKIMDVHIDMVDFYSTLEEPNATYGGYYCFGDRSIHINTAYIYSGDPLQIEWQIYAIFHELKHARQHEAVNGAIYGTKDYGYSHELLQSWYENIYIYVNPEESDELYRKQPLEADSYGFTSIISSERQFEML